MTTALTVSYILSDNIFRKNGTFKKKYFLKQIKEIRAKITKMSLHKLFCIFALFKKLQYLTHSVYNNKLVWFC